MDTQAVRFRRAWIALVAIPGALLHGMATAQSTWIPTSGTLPWTTGTAWSGGIAPDAIDAVAVFPSAGPTVLLDDTTVNLGTINQTTASGNVVIGSTGGTGSVTDWINLAVSSGVPVISVTGGNLYMYAQLSGSQGLRKNGNGVYSPRYNTTDFTYTGTNTFGGGTIQIARDGQLGDPSNPIEVVASTIVQNWGASWATSRPIAISAGGLTVQNGAAANIVSLGGSISGTGGLTLNTGNFSLGAANSSTGPTTVRSATVSLTSGAVLSSGSLTLQTSATNTGGSLIDLGGASQSVASISLSLASAGTLQVSNTIRNGALTVAGGGLTVNSGFASAQTGTTQFDLRGLSAFTWGTGSNAFEVSTTATSTGITSATVMSLPTTGSATLAASFVRIGNSANGPASSTSTLSLGLANSIATGTLTVGAYRGNGVLAFAGDVSGGSLLLRGVAGGDARVDTVYVGFKGGGDNFGNGVLDVSSGSIDARVNAFNVGYYFVNASAAQTGTFAMGSGTLDATTLTLGSVNVASGSAGSPTITSVVQQAGGRVVAGSLVLGANAATLGANAPNFRSTYTLAGGTLAAGRISSGTGSFNAGSQRRITWTGGVITTASGSADMAVAGVSGSGGAVLMTVAGADAKALDVPAGRRVTLGDYVTLSGSDTGFTKTGEGRLVIGGGTGFVSTYSGSLTVQAGDVRVADGSALATGLVIPLAGGTFSLSPFLGATVGGLSANAGGLTDVGSGLLTVAGGLSTADMLVALLAGRGDGSWTGTSGITSSQAAADIQASIPRTVGWLDNGGGSVSAAFAAPGDTNLDWSVDILDAANFLAGGKFDSAQPASWNEGDFGYDGVVDILDAADFLSTGLFDAGSYNPPPAGGSVAAVPEPSLAAAAAVALLACGVAASRRR